MTERDDWRREMFGERLASFFDAWVKRLELSHWNIAADMDDLPDGNTLAMCEVNKRLGHRARLTFTEKVFHLPDCDRETIIIHELLHIPLDDLAQFATRGMSEQDKEWFARLLETFTADLSEVLYNLTREQHDDSL